MAAHNNSQRDKKSKSLSGGFWSNFFRTQVDRPEPTVGSQSSDPLLVSVRPKANGLSLESLNTIQSTHSFAFLTPKSYANGIPDQRRRGRRIPVEVEDSHFRSKPHKPQEHKSGTGSKGLKSKYNLQSCESLVHPVLLEGQLSLLDPPGPSRLAQRSHRVQPSPLVHRRHHRPSGVKKYPSNFGSKDLSAVDPLPKKRRAPLPPTFDLSTLQAPVNKGENQRHRRCQSDTTALKPRAHVEGKRRAPSPPRLKLLTSPLTTEPMPGKKVFQEITRFPGSSHGVGQEVKLPRPWYKRSSQGNIKSPIQKPSVNLPNFSKLDQEAAQIVQENNRRSAELSYNQSAKELITMFNSTFAQEETTSGPKVVPVKVVGTNGFVPELVETKKLAVVQPQKTQVAARVTEKVQNSPPASSVSRSTTSQVSPGEPWQCPRCTLINSSWRTFCDVCVYRKGAEFNVTSPLAQGRSTFDLDLQHGSSQLGSATNGIVTHPGNDLDLHHGSSRLGSTANGIVTHPGNENSRGESSSRMRVQPQELNAESTSKSRSLPPCENFLSQIPAKENSKKGKLSGLKLLEQSELESELGIDALREARVAFFTKNAENGVSNDLNPVSDTRPKELTSQLSQEGLDVVQFLLQIHSDQINYPKIGQPQQSHHQPRPIRQAILESIKNSDFEKVFQNLTEVHCGTRGNGLGRRNVQKLIAQQMELCEELAKAAKPQDPARVAAVLLKKVDEAISEGDYRLAAKFAYDLALVPPTFEKSEDDPITIRVYVEDRMMQQGPFLMPVTPSMTVGNLKEKIEQDWNIPGNFQKWILGKEMAENDDEALKKFGMRNESLAFLYLVTPEFPKGQAPPTKISTATNVDVAGDNNLPKETTTESCTNTVSTTPETPQKFPNDPRPSASTSSSARKIENVPPGPEPIVLNFNNEQTTIGDRSSQGPTPTSAVVASKVLVAEESPSATKLKPEAQKIEQPPNVASTSKNVVTPFNIPPTPVTSKTVERRKLSLPENSKALNFTVFKSNSKPSSRRTSVEENQFPNRNSMGSGPFKRAGSGSLSKQIQMFEALNSAAQAQGQKPKEPVSSSVTPVTKMGKTSIKNELENGTRSEMDQDPNANYQKLVELEKSHVIRSQGQIECPICFSEVAPGNGVVLRDCLHSFCVECLTQVIQFAEEAEIKCPYRDRNYACESVIQEREIKGLVPVEIFNRILAKSVKLAECKISNAFHCKTTDCPGWCVFEDTVNSFHCPVCSKSNCLNCQAIHESLDCQQYQRELAIAAETDEDAKTSRIMLEKMIQRGEALECPACHVVLLKKWGCDWVRCSYCKTEICWVTKSFRWGPNGKGDLSGGCKCGVNGVKCHPRCTYCH